MADELEMADRHEMAMFMLRSEYRGSEPGIELIEDGIGTFAIPGPSGEKTNVFAIHTLDIGMK